MTLQLQGFQYYAILFLAGAGGAFIRSLLVNKGNVVLWRTWSDKKSGKRGVDLGIIAGLLIGGTVGVLVDQSPFTAFAWAITGSYLIEELIKINLQPENEVAKHGESDEARSGDISDSH